MYPVMMQRCVQPLFKRFCRCFDVSFTRSPHLQVFNDPKSTFVVVKQFDQMFHIQAMPCVNVVLRWLWNGRQCQWCSNHNMKVHLIFRQDGAPPLPPRYNRRQTQSEKKKKSDSHWMKREHAAHHTQTKRTKYNNVVHLPVAPKSTRPTPLHVWICLIFIEYVTGHQGIPVLQGIFDKTFFGNVHSSNVGVCNCCRFKTTRYQSDRCVLGHQCFKGVFVGRVWVANHFGQDTKIWWIVQRRRKTKRELLQFFTGKQDRPTHAEYAMGVDGQEHFGGGGFFGQILFVRQGTISKIHGGTFGHEGTKRRGVWPWHDVTGGDGRCHQQGSWLVVEVEQAQHEDGREEWK